MLGEAGERDRRFGRLTGRSEPHQLIELRRLAHGLTQRDLQLDVADRLDDCSYRVGEATRRGF